MGELEFAQALHLAMFRGLADADLGTTFALQSGLRPKCNADLGGAAARHADISFGECDSPSGPVVVRLANAALAHIVAKNRQQ